MSKSFFNISRRCLGKALAASAVGLTGGFFSRATIAAEKPAAAITTVCIVVANMQKSAKFYTEIFGFKPLKPEPIRATAKPGDLQANAVELDQGFDVLVQFFDAGSIQLELIEYLAPKPLGSGIRAPVNHRGVNHLTIQVSDPQATVLKAHGMGATVLDSKPTGDIVFVVDPDGTRLEIIKMA